MQDDSSALVLFSGGQDSTTCLAWALSRYKRVETIGFRYGQRHLVEMDARPIILGKIRSVRSWLGRLEIDHEVPVDFSDLTTSALTNEEPLATRADGLPSTFVPGRNILFLTLAAIVANQRGLRFIVGGMCETDFSGYPDCRDDTLKALQVALNLGMLSRTTSEQRIVIETPLMWLTKRQTWELAQELGGLELVNIIIDDTHTCYLGRRDKHEWGAGCDACDACRLRARGWREYKDRWTEA